MKHSNNIKLKAFVARFLLCAYVAIVAFQFGLHQQIHHKHQDYNVQVLLNSEKFCHHESSLEQVASHAHLDIATVHCDFCDQLFQQALYSVPSNNWSAKKDCFDKPFGNYLDQNISALLIISRNKSPPIFIS